MSESKLKRIIIAVSAGAVILIVTLICVMVFQLISINSARRETAELESAIEKYNALTAEEQDTLEQRQTRDWIIDQARRLGYVFEDDHVLD